jgi:hypothetical protein
VGFGKSTRKSAAIDAHDWAVLPMAGSYEYAFLPILEMAGGDELLSENALFPMAL